METHQELLSAYELANRIVAEAPIYRERGQADLLKLAWDCTNAENARLIASQNRATMMRDGVEYPRSLAEALERDTAKARVACEAFAIAYDSFREKRLKAT
jgi:hypothetical protein